MHYIIAMMMVCLSVAACQRERTDRTTTANEVKGGTGMAMTITSAAFGEGQRIPKKYTCDGEDVSPPLKWSGAPKGTQSFALICDDPDAPMGTWTHWVVWGIPADVDSLQEDVRSESKLPAGARNGENSWRRLGYGGPCPPPGNPHRYFFKLYALDAPIDPSGTPDKLAIEKAMEGHVLDVAQIMGRYGR